MRQTKPLKGCSHFTGKILYMYIVFSHAGFSRSKYIYIFVNCGGLSTLRQLIEILLLLHIPSNFRENLVMSSCIILASISDHMDVLIVFNAISCRRTGVPLNIKARKDSHGFENINDYFPDSGEVIVIIIIIIILLSYCKCFDVHVQ